MDILLSSERLLDVLGHEELRLKQAGLAIHAQGMRAAIVAVIRMTQHPEPPKGPPPLEPSE
jgi:hypothetical protein